MHGDVPGSNIEIDTRSLREKVKDNKYNPYWMFRDNESLKSKIQDFPKKYYDILNESTEKAKKKAERVGDVFDPYKGQAWRVTKAIGMTGFHKIVKPPLQYAGSQVASMMSGMGKQVGMSNMIENAAEKFGLKIESPKDKDIMTDNSDGSISLNKEFFKNRGKFAIPKTVVSLQMKMGRHLLQILGAMSAYGWCASLGPPGAIFATILISMAMKNTIKNLTVDVFKQVLAATYSTIVYGFKDKDVTKVKLVDMDKNGNPKLTKDGLKVSKIIAELESSKLPLLDMPDDLTSKLDEQERDSDSVVSDTFYSDVPETSVSTGRALDYAMTLDKDEGLQTVRVMTESVVQKIEMNKQKEKPKNEGRTVSEVKDLSKRLGEEAAEKVKGSLIGSNISHGDAGNKNHEIHTGNKMTRFMDKEGSFSKPRSPTREK